MSKQSKRQKNTLFNYFQSLNGSFSSPNKHEQKVQVEDDSDEDVVACGKRKRTRRFSESDDEHVDSPSLNNSNLITSDSDNENNQSTSRSEEPVKKKFTFVSSPANKKKRMSMNRSDVENKLEASALKPKKILLKRKMSNDGVSKATNAKKNDSSISSKKEAADDLNESASETREVVGAANDGNWEHNKMKFLQPKYILDANKRRPDHPDYDKNTLYLPEDFLSQQTPAMHQWWILKSKHYDSVLFFKVGKFYELYHMDAVIGVTHLALSYMRGSFAHSGFPEIAYGRMATSLIEQGLKVARVEQTETPEMMANRCKSTLKPTKFDKVVNREICQITSKATCVYGVQLQEAKHSLPCYMIAIAEKSSASGTRFGVCFIDTSIGVFNLAEFDDDRYYSRLLALLAQHPPELILTERGHTKTDTSNLLKKTFINIRQDKLAPKTQFYDAQTTIDTLMNGCYFLNDNNDFEWPPVLNNLVEKANPKTGHELTWKSLGACIWHLKYSLIDVQVLSLKKFEIFEPIDTAESGTVTRNFMVLDSLTIGHLDMLGGEGTLQHSIDFCATPFGKRLLQQWICRPLCAQRNIELRQEAVKELMSDDQMRSSARAVLKNLPDLERLIVKIHAFGNRFLVDQHPDSRAIFYDASTYSVNKTRDLVSALQAFESTNALLPLFSECKSAVLKGLTSPLPHGQFCDLKDRLEYFKRAFDQNDAQTKFKIMPKLGMNREYDDTLAAISALEQEIEKFRCKQEKFFGCKVDYSGTGKNRFQLEIPENKCNKVTADYKLESSRKGSKPVRRYSNLVTAKFLADMVLLEAKRDKIVLNLNRLIFEKFSDSSENWQQVIQCLTMLDVLIAFAEYAKNSRHTITFPKVLPFSDEPYIKIEDGVHPCTTLEDFVPNGTRLGTCDNAKIMILTGPNMGGKSTLMRQAALITVMAQMGCPVPATSCELTLVDRIFTRMGAQDDIVQRHSTFMVELSEAAIILRHATKHSFVLIDELGRGTSTHDGNAVASAYLNKLTSFQCRTIFSTHYHSLVKRFCKRDGIQLAHMAYLSEGKDNEQNVTFLYQLANGNCPESYGFNVAKQAGLSNSIIENARNVAVNLEKRTFQHSDFRSLMSENARDICSIMYKFAKL